METLFKDGYKRDIKFGDSLRGIKHNNSRPISITINLSEVTDLCDLKGGDAVLKYFYSAVVPCTAVDGKVIIK